MAETAFGVTYDGPDLVSGRMPVRDLAPALLALGDIFAEASVLLYPDRKPAALNIQATREGSFEVQLILETAWDHLIDIFGSDAAAALLNLKEYIVGGSFGLFWLIKRLRGRRIARRDEGPAGGMIRLTLDDGTVIEVPAAVLELYGNIGVRKHVRDVVEPLTREGVDRLEFRSESEVTVQITAGDVDAYEVPADEAVPLEDIEIPMVVSIASVAFTEGNKWRLSDGERTFFASIDDTGFLERVDHGIEAFRNGDMLRTRMRIQQSQQADGLHSDYHVLEVVEHIPRQMQLRLDAPEVEPRSDSPEVVGE